MHTKQIGQHHYSIMPLFADHVEELCQDIKQQIEQGITTLPLFCMTLVPEGNPPVDKVSELCRIYDMYRDRLAQMGLECGILVQASVGHGYPLNAMFPFQRYVGRTDGEEKNKVCPYDEGFREYFKGIMATLASHKPKTIMVDDDFRLLFFYGRGCVCPLHMKRFHALSGTEMTREELNERIAVYGEKDRYVQLYLQTQRESLIGAAEAMRAGIDSVDPTIQGAYCSTGCACEFAPDIAKVLAGKDNPTVVRTFIGLYCPSGAKNLTTPFYRVAQHKALMKGKVDYLLAESDTCPHNRYALSARQFHSYFVGSVLEGTDGSKRWITKTNHYEPQSGIAYRKILAEHSGFYNKLTELVAVMKPVGCCIPVLKEPFYALASEEWELLYDGWSRCVLERLGLPLFFSSEPDGAVFMEGDVDRYFTDSEIQDLLKGTLILASDTAENLNHRGFTDLMGVKVQQYTKTPVSGEYILASGYKSAAQRKTREIVVTASDVRVDSQVYFTQDKKNLTMLFPGSTVYKNALGGTCVTFAGTPVAPYTYTDAFGFLHSGRKQQLISILKETNNLPVYYPGDAEVYLRAGFLPDGSLLTAIFDLPFDPLEKLELVVEKEVTEVSILRGDGSFAPCSFVQSGDAIVIDQGVQPLLPVVLVIK